jgi:isoquinoline 1-oxidoreductase beta subunit
MTNKSNTVERRDFLKASLLAGGGLFLQFNWFSAKAEEAVLPNQWYDINGYIKIADNNIITLYNPNPEFGQNVKTSLPMILAEELDVEWEKVIVEQGDFYPERFDRQFTGGSNSVRQHWPTLRKAGATARTMLITAAATAWKVPAEEITTDKGFIIHTKSNKKAAYGEFASSASKVSIPQNVILKDNKQFKIVGSSKKNVDNQKIITGKPLFGIDYKVDGMLYAMIVHPPAFGLRFKSMDDSAAKKMKGIKSIFTFESLGENFEQGYFDTTSFRTFVAIVGTSTWEVLQAKKALKVQWEEEPVRKFKMVGWGPNAKPTEFTYPAGLENTDKHRALMEEYARTKKSVLRKDGDPDAAFKNAVKIIERTYTAPFLAHSTMEPVNCFAHVNGDKAEFYGPTQAPDLIASTLAQRLKIPKENIKINLARMGGGFGRRAYGHHFVEAGVISQHLKAPVKLLYTREDEMTAGIYRPMYTATYRAALDQNNNLIGLHIIGGGVPENPIHANRFPAGAIDNYLAEGFEIPSNITIGAFRAPRSNFNAAAEQSFLDELAAEMKKDPIDFRLELLERAKTNPVGKNNDYDATRYSEVIKLVKEKSKWSQTPAGVHRGVAAYFCHNSYAAEVVDIEIVEDSPRVKNVVAAVDCGIVVNKDAAINMVEGAVIDGIGNVLYGEMNFVDGEPQKDNFHSYRLIRMNEIPQKIDVHFVDNGKDPSGLGEPPFPPVFGAVANALFKATGKRFYNQPFIQQFEEA